MLYDHCPLFWKCLSNRFIVRSNGFIVHVLLFFWFRRNGFIVHVPLRQSVSSGHNGPQESFNLRPISQNAGFLPCRATGNSAAADAPAVMARQGRRAFASGAASLTRRFEWRGSTDFHKYTSVHSLDFRDKVLQFRILLRSKQFDDDFLCRPLACTYIYQAKPLN